MTNIQQALQQASQQLVGSSDSPRLDAELLLAHCLQRKRSYLYTWPEHCLTEPVKQAFVELIRQRQQGQPIAYLSGYREFWGRDFQVSPATLIPRPDTERLIDIALSKIPLRQAYRVLDLGTGSGAIAITLAKERPQANIIAVDCSGSALEIAQANVLNHQANNVQLYRSNWFSALRAQDAFQIIVSNPPYVSTTDPHLQQGDVRHEPQSALVAGEDGLDHIRHLINRAPDHLETDGWLLLEHGYDQRKKIACLLQQAGYRQIQCQQDMAGHDRVSLGQCPA